MNSHFMKAFCVRLLTLLYLSKGMYTATVQPTVPFIPWISLATGEDAQSPPCPLQ